MIFYFSGTGSSQLAAKQINDTIQDEKIFINHELKNGKLNTFRSHILLVYVVSTYAWRMPRVILHCK